MRTRNNSLFGHFSCSVNRLEEFRYDIEALTFLLSDLLRKYDKKLVDILPQELGSSPTTHSTRLKDEILAEISDLQYRKEKVSKDTLSSIQK